MPYTPISFGDAPGALFNQLGSIAYWVKIMAVYQSDLETAMINVSSGTTAQLENQPDIQALVGGAYIGQVNGVGTIGQLAQTVCAQIANRAVFDSNPRIGQTLTSQNTLASLQEIIRQMKIAGATVLAMTITATPQPFSNYASNVGNGLIVTSVRRPVDGLVLENSYAESLQVVCTQDSYLGGATKGNEGFTVTGTGNQSNVFAFDWPLGSNATLALSAINGSADNSQGNTLTNSSWDTWDGTTTGVPDNWDLVTGTAGVSIQENQGISYDGIASLQIIGDGSTLVELDQTFNDDDGTLGALEPLSQYAYNIFALRDGIAAASGTLRIGLLDTDTNQIINDENNVPNSFTIDLTALTTAWISYTGVFRTPQVMPSNYKLQMILTAALTNGRSVYLDKSGLGLMQQVYVSGPYMAIFSGNVPFEQGSYTFVDVSNSRGAGGTLNTFQTWLARAFGEVITNELLFPSSSTPTLSDGLIV